MSVNSGFKFSKIFIVQSLDGGDSDTGRQLSEYIEPIAIEQRINFEFKICESADSFRKILKDLESFADSGGIPLLHVECHGDLDTGLLFSDKSSMTWGSLSSALLPINIKTGFNLLTVFSACYGGYLLSDDIKDGLTIRCPVRAFIGPSSVIKPDEALRGLRPFYEILLTSDSFCQAELSLKKQKPQHGYWMSISAEFIYENFVRKYMAEDCSESAIRKKAIHLFKRDKSSGKIWGIGSAKRAIKALLKGTLPGSCFEAFFSIDKVPENKERFESFRQKVIKLTRSI